jgi:hypothetical protein
MFTALAATSRTVTEEIADSLSMSSLAQRLSGMASVGLKGDRVGERDVEIVDELGLPAGDCQLWVLHLWEDISLLETPLGPTHTRVGCGREGRRPSQLTVWLTCALMTA